MTIALRNQPVGVEAGATARALPSPKAAPLMGDASVRGFTVTTPTGVITGSVPVLSATTDDVAGAYNWAAYADSLVPLDGTGWTSNITSAAALTAFNNP